MATYLQDSRTKMTTARLRALKAEGRKIACLTAYDFTMASLLDQAGIDFILVGDSAANVMMGYDTTLPITLDEIITYAKGVVRGAPHALIVVDMPFGYYQGQPDVAVRSAVRIMKETGAHAVKMEGGAEITDSITRVLAAGIPVCAHLGLTPQSVNQFGGYGVRAKESAEAQRLISDAKLLQDLGCFALVLEKIPQSLAAQVTELLTIPTIGIGAGAVTDGQILVIQDMLGMNSGFKPKFLRQFAQIGTQITQAVENYITEVRASTFPSDTEHY